jgi:hypothetical protein
MVIPGVVTLARPERGRAQTTKPGRPSLIKNRNRWQIAAFHSTPQPAQP